MIRLHPKNLSSLSMLVLLAGCGSLRGLLEYPGHDPAPVPVAAAAPAPAPAPAQPAAPQPDEWCLHVAANDRAQAAANGFDAATQDRVTAQSYRQCVALKAS
jgi:hypothetical protein